jgi:predicted butyrate kinase (DUF1464 family)
MKKNLLLLFALAVLFTGMNACKSKVETPAVEELVAPVETVVEEVSATAEGVVSSINVPSFESQEVNEFVGEYKSLMTEYAELKGTGNESAAAELAAKFNTWSEGAASIASQIKAEEMQKFNDFIGEAETKFNEMKTAVTN